jgi:hypothetical protein
VLVTVADFFTEVFKQSFLPSEAGSTPTASRSTKRANGKGAASTRVSRFVRATFACTENYPHFRTSHTQNAARDETFFCPSSPPASARSVCSAGAGSANRA